MPVQTGLNGACVFEWIEGASGVCKKRRLILYVRVVWFGVHVEFVVNVYNIGDGGYYALLCVHGIRGY